MDNHGGGSKIDLPCILRLLIKLVDSLYSTEFREFENKCKIVYPFMTRILITTIFNLFQQFVKLTKNSHVIRGIKVTGIVSINYVTLVLLMHNDPMFQL